MNALDGLRQVGCPDQNSWLILSLENRTVKKPVILAPRRCFGNQASALVAIGYYMAAESNKKFFTRRIGNNMIEVVDLTCFIGFITETMELD
ncbi:uncharacterized protein PHALS_00296 [Plasmopara halstedii]|uniref:Uncharacterized protein n=1 Tax=Plasmopara halstedii TaxID=4781 RepID=A0A0P1A7J3_PLAHL|nr:uncharacterized protein PHALS_00296 [Plasmopara halstedii]CEG35974.1 hypothetical protein PHALS_00296 [Plasmopara halstedii]|eukprot:XP_024572343.1 hypothetical protein PHALS_00296 [Plasmopara halstedii]